MISDLDEGVTRHEESTETVSVDDPADLSYAAEVDDEMNRGAAAIGSTRRSSVNSTKTTNRSSTQTTHTYGKNGWIWCAAVEPENEQQSDAWRRSLGDDYDCVTTIKSPRQLCQGRAGLDRGQIDAANAEVEARPDDARITKLVVDLGPGGTAKMLGVRKGLTGTYRRRVRYDHATFRVETMNPDATIVIDPRTAHLTSTATPSPCLTAKTLR